MNNEKVHQQKQKLKQAPVGKLVQGTTLMMDATKQKAVEAFKGLSMQDTLLKPQREKSDRKQGEEEEKKR